MSSSGFWCHFCRNVVRIPSACSPVFCPTCNLGFVEEISNEPGLLLIPSNHLLRDLPTDSDFSFGDSRSSSPGRNFLRRIFRSHRSSRHNSEERPSLLQVLEIASLLQRSTNTEGSNEREADDTGSGSSLRISLENSGLSSMLRAAEDGAPMSGISTAEGSHSLLERPGDSMQAPRPLEILLQRLLADILQSGRSGSLPASKTAIAAMPTFKIDKQNFGSDSCGGLDEPLTECAVCKEVFEIGGEVKEMPCKHFYHSNCILPWLELHSSCPLCRREMPVDVHEEPSSSAISDRVVGGGGGQPIVVFIGISGTGVLVFSFIMVGSASRNVSPVATSLEGEQSSQVSGTMETAGEVASENGERLAEALTREAADEVDAGSSMIAGELLASEAVAEVETDERNFSEANALLSSPPANAGKATEQVGSLVNVHESSQISSINSDVEGGSGVRGNTTRGVLDESGPWNESRLRQLMDDDQAEPFSGSRSRSFFSWIFRHGAARHASPNLTESSENSTSRMSHDDADEDAP